MPWAASDAKGHTKEANTKAKQEKWAKVANNARAQCMKDGGEAEECDARAIRIANAAVKEADMPYKAYTMSTNNVLITVNAIDVDGQPVPVAELVAAYLEQRGEGQGQGEERQGDGGAEACVCPECKREFSHERGTPCNERECPDCGVALTGKSKAAEMAEAVWTTAFVNDLPDSSFAVIMPGGEKDEGGKTKPRSLRKLPYKDASGKVDIPHLRNALARLPQMKGVSSELKAKAMRTLQAAAKKHLKTHQEEAEKVDIDKVKDLLQEALAMLDIPQEMAEADLCENIAADAFIPDGDHSAAILEVVKEAGITAGEGRRAPVVVDLQIIRPGPGNERDNRYYPSATLRNYAHVFEGADVFVTDHKAKERSEKTKVGRIRGCPVRFTEAGGPVGRTIVYDPDMAEKIRNRADAGELNTLHCSIYGKGDIRPGKVDGVKYDIVETIKSGPLVEFVSKAGAGGHAVGLAENDAGGVNMDQEKIKELLSESELPQESQERLAGAEYKDEGAVKEAILQEKAQLEAPQKLAEAEVSKMLSETNLPSASKKRLVGAEYEDESALREAILAEVEYVKALTGSGQPFAQGGQAQQKELKPLSERLDAIDERYGLHGRLIHIGQALKEQEG